MPAAPRQHVHVHRPGSTILLVSTGGQTSTRTLARTHQKIHLFGKATSPAIVMYDSPVPSAHPAPGSAIMEGSLFKILSVPVVGEKRCAFPPAPEDKRWIAVILTVARSAMPQRCHYCLAQNNSIYPAQSQTRADSSTLNTFARHLCPSRESDTGVSTSFLFSARAWRPYLRVSFWPRIITSALL